MIVLDIDGVVADICSEVVWTLKERGFDVAEAHEWGGGRWEDNIFQTPSHVVSDVIHSNLTMRNCRPFEDSWYWVNHYIGIHNIIFMTARNPDSRKATETWFTDWEIPYDGIVFSQSKALDLAEMGNVDLFVEDDAHNALAAFDLGIPTYLINRPYNKQVLVPDYIRINSLWDIDMEDLFYV